MAGNRQAAQSFILKYIDKMMPGGANKKIYEDLFAKMSDKDFDEFMTKLETGEEMLAIIAPNLAKESVTMENNMALGKELNHEWFQRIWITPDDGTAPYLTPEKYLVTWQPGRRQAQLLVKKISIPEDNRSINDLTGQPASTGKSRGAKISLPETQVLAALGLDNTLIEAIKYRGGDAKGFVYMNQSISKTGGVSLNELAKYNTRVKSTDTLRTYLTCMHFKVDL
jgi:hypothetical protein